MKPEMLKVENFSKSYAPGQKVLHQINFSLQASEFLYVLGGSGVGKSSLLRTIATLEQPTEGSIQIFGSVFKRWKGSELTRIRRRVSFIPQSLGLISGLTVADHVQLVKKNTHHSQQLGDQEIESLVKTLGLEKKWKENVETLSGGERQRVAILRALTRKSDLLIADEPTGAQDFEMTWKLMDLFVKAQLSGTAILFATHDLEIVRRLRKRVAILKDGFMKVEA